MNVVTMIIVVVLYGQPPHISELGPFMNLGACAAYSDTLRTDYWTGIEKYGPIASMRPLIKFQCIGRMEP